MKMENYKSKRELKEIIARQKHEIKISEYIMFIELIIIVALIIGRIF